MSNKLSQIDAFLRKYNQHPDIIDVAQITDNMVEEMNLGLQGKDSSLLMIPTYLTDEGNVPLDQPAIVIDAGGTNLRIGIVTFTTNGIVVDKLHKQKMLGIDRALTKDEFIEQMSDLIIPYLQYSNKIGFVFSFAFESLPNKDGKVIGLSKEVKIDCVGALLGQEIKDCLKKKGISQDVSIVLLNDTVSTLLGGPAVAEGHQFDGQIGLILGTGTNTAYPEKTAGIEKIDAGYDGKMIINMESGGFDKFPLGEFDQRLDAASVNPGQHLFEKCISGVYLGNIICETIRQAAKEGLFSDEAAISELPYFSMVEVDSFLRAPFGDNLLADSCASDEDREVLSIFIDRAMDRASKLVAINLAACIVKMDAGKEASRPCRIVVEGSTFHKCFQYKEKIDYYLKDYVNHQLGRYYYFTSGDDVNLAGSCQAALLNG